MPLNLRRVRNKSTHIFDGFSVALLKDFAVYAVSRLVATKISIVPITIQQN